MNNRDVIRSLDWVILGSSGLLIAVSFAMLINSARLTTQAISAGIGAIFLLLIARVSYHVWRRYIVAIYIAAIIFLGVVLSFGQIIRGTVSRLELFSFQFQPSEFAKVALILALAWVFSRRQKISGVSFMQSALIAAVPVFLIAREPDTGMAMLLLGLWAVLISFMGLSWRMIGLLAGAVIASVVAAWRWLLLEYQKERMLVFLDPTRDPLGSGYNALQSIIAVGSGQVFGRGLGHGPQSQLQFLPERHTDFMLASIGEELGFIGISLVLMLYAIIIWRMLSLGARVNDQFGRTLVISVAILLMLSLAINAGMNFGLLPITGLPLPLVSYGGSNLLTTLILIGLVQSVHVYSTWDTQLPDDIGG